MLKIAKLFKSVYSINEFKGEINIRNFLSTLSEPNTLVT